MPSLLYIINAIKNIYLIAFLFLIPNTSYSQENNNITVSRTVSNRNIQYKFSYPDGYYTNLKNKVDNTLALGISKNGISGGVIVVLAVPQTETIDNNTFKEYFSGLKDSDLPSKDLDIISKSFINIGDKYVYNLRGVGRSPQNNLVGFSNIVLSGGILTRVDCFSNTENSFDNISKFCSKFISEMSYYESK